jgi:hypothetical protein
MRILLATCVWACLVLTTLSHSPTKAHVWLDIYGAGVRDHSHVHIPHFISPYYHGSRKARVHHGLSPQTNHKGRCWRWAKLCSVNWSIGTVDYNGCLKYHGCYYE